MQSDGCNRCRDRQITILFHSPLTQMNEKYWSFSFLISILSPNFDKEWNVRKFDLDFYHFLNEKYQTDKVQYVFLIPQIIGSH